MKILSILFLCLSTWVQAAVYEWQDAKGRKHYTDQPTTNAKVLDIQPGYGFFQVKRVYDGDTLELDNGTKIRLLGINTPEVQHRGNAADAGGDEAKRWLIEKVKNRKVRLLGDVEKTDKYGRTLAHVFTDKKEHLNLELVTLGLAAVSIYPPNLLFVDDLVKAQAQAEQKKAGIWQRPEYQPIPVTSLTDEGHTGWVRLYGRVDHVRQTKKALYLAFSSQFEAKIERNMLSLFPDIASYPGNVLEVRGWLNKNRGKFSMLIRHPSAIKVR